MDLDFLLDSLSYSGPIRRYAGADPDRWRRQPDRRRLGRQLQGPDVLLRVVLSQLQGPDGQGQDPGSHRRDGRFSSGLLRLLLGHVQQPDGRSGGGCRRRGILGWHCERLDVGSGEGSASDVRFGREEWQGAHQSSVLDQIRSDQMRDPHSCSCLAMIRNSYCRN